MNKKYTFSFAIIAVILFVTGDLLAQYQAVVYGNRVRIRAKAGTDSKVIGVVNTGDVFDVIAKSDTRDTLNKKFNWGYHWYRIRINNSGRGWLYGRFCYSLNDKTFYSSARNKSSIERQILNLNGKYSFRVGTEPAYPPMNSKGLTDSEIHGLPVIIKWDSAKALPVWLPDKEGDDFLFREKRHMNTWFRLKNNTGVGEKVEAVSVSDFRGKKAVTIDIKYQSQESAGSYRIICVPEKNRLTIKKHKVTGGPGW